METSFYIVSHAAVMTYKTDFGLDDWIYFTLYIHNSELQTIQRYGRFAHITVHRYTRTSPILATDLSVSLSLQLTLEAFLAQSNCFLAISSQSPSTVISRTQSNSNSSCMRSSLYSLEADGRKHCFLYCCEGVFTAPLHNNGSYSIVAFIFVATGICLPSRCLAMFIHVTVVFYRSRLKR
jgi:hypothetical protein